MSAQHPEDKNPHNEEKNEGMDGNGDNPSEMGHRPERAWPYPSSIHGTKSSGRDPEEPLQPGSQLSGIERFHYVIIGPCSKGLLNITLV
jgi:hypothetical protein